MPIEGVDYADSVPSASALKAAGKRFAVRYGGPGRDSKQLTASELRALRSAGIDIVANAEGAASGFTGRTAGRSWAQQALNHFGPLGMPPGRPVYFSVDWDAGPGDWAGIDAALAGAAEILGAKRVGVYGSYDTIAHCKNAGTAAWFWQTYAWSSGRWHPAAHIQQYKNGVAVGGADCDLDRAMTSDYGQWGVNDVALEASDKTWFTNEMKRLLEQDGAVARGLRQQPNNLSDTERNKLTDVIEGRLKPLILSVDTDEAEVTAGVVQGVLSGMATAEGAVEMIADAVVAALPAGLATDVANQILAKQGQAMLDASDDPAAG